MRPLPRLRDLVRPVVPAGELRRLCDAGAEAYRLIDDAPAGSWERVAAWNAFLPHLYADNLLAKEDARSVPAATAAVVRELLALAAGWLERAEQLRAAPQRSLAVDPRRPLPHWRTPLRSLPQLAGMRATLEDARVRVASEFAGLGAEPPLAPLAERLQAIDAKIETVDLLWVARNSEELRGAIGDALSGGLDAASELGQLLARPELLEQRRR